MNLTLERSYPTSFANSTLLPLLLVSLAKQRYSPDPSTEFKKEYDYVIVGAGAAGSVVASRLSELPCVSVLLLEAGPKPPLLTDIPAIARSFWFTDIDWQYRTAPQNYTGKALINREFIWPAGKTIGGSSTINVMAYVRGNKQDYDDWEAMGAKGWSYNDVFPYFLKLEDNRNPKFLANGYHAKGGPVTVHQPKYRPDLKRALFKAAVDLGYEVLDSNAERQTGFYSQQANLRKSQRCSTAKAYLVPAENRTNLDIVANAMVRKVIISNKRATGVQFDFKGQTYEVKAKKEVILSAGTVNTAKLLMLSGVGPKTELEQFNISVKADLPVGMNLHDHGATYVVFELDPSMPDFDQKLRDPDNIREYIQNRTGPLASMAATVMLAFLKGQEIRPAIDSPNYELYLGEFITEIARDQFGLIPEVYKRYFGPYENKPLFLCTVAEVQPRSRGTVTLRTTDPYDSPVINPNYLKDPKDIEDMVQGMKTCHKLAESKHLRRLGVKPLKTLMPGCEKYARDESNYSRCYLRSLLTTFFHPVGTAKMGETTDPTTVVDSRLRVKNITGLRVVDSSVMPKITTGNTHIPTIMIAEKASDIIKETIFCHNKPTEHWNVSLSSENLKEERIKEEGSLWIEEDSEDTNEHKDSSPEEQWIEQEDKPWKQNEEYEEEQEKPSVDNDVIISFEIYKTLPQEWSGSDFNSEESDFSHQSPWEDEEDENEQDLKAYMTDQKAIPFIKEEQFDLDYYWKDFLASFWNRKKPNDKIKQSSMENVEEADFTTGGFLHGYKWGDSHMKSMIPWL